MRHLDSVQQFEQQRRASAFVQHALSEDSYISDNDSKIAEFQRRTGGAFIRTKSSAMLASDEPIDSMPLRHAYLSQVEAASLISRLTGSLPIPVFGVSTVSQLASITAQRVDEGQPKPIARLDFALNGPPVKTTAEVIVSMEWLRATDPATQQAVSAHLTQAAARAIDAELIALLTAGSPAGSADAGALLAALSNGAPVRPALIGTYATLLDLDADVMRLAQSLGVAVLPSAVAGSTLIAVDMAGLAIGISDPLVQTARHAVIEMDGSPGSIINLWQSNLAALRSEIFLRAAVRAGAVVYAS